MTVTVAMGGLGAGHSIPERMLEAIGRRHRSSGEPRELTVIHPFGVGHWSMSPSMAKLAAENLFEAYCLPAGIPAEGLEFGAAYNSTAIIGTGGFIDIAQKARKVVFCGTLAVRGGKPKFVPAVRQVTFSGANAVSTGQEVLYVTEAAVFRLTAEGLQLEEVAPSFDAECDVVAKMAFRPLVGASLGRMRAELFAPPLLPADCFPAFQ